MTEFFGLGQREITPGESFEPTEEEKALLDRANVSISAVQTFVDVAGAKMTLNAAIGGIQTQIKK